MKAEDFVIKANGAPQRTQTPRRTRSRDMFLATNCRAELVKKSPGPFFTDTGREVGKRWQALSDKQKTPRETKPSDDKARHEKAMKTRGVTHTASSKYHDEIISLVFIHTKY
jgi:hypothetical protein